MNIELAGGFTYCILRVIIFNMNQADKHYLQCLHESLVTVHILDSDNLGSSEGHCVHS